MSQNPSLSIFNPDGDSPSPEPCQELMNAVDAAIYEVERAEAVLRDRIFALLDCRKNHGLSVNGTNFDRLRAVVSSNLNTMVMVLTDLRDHVGIPKQGIED